MAAVSALLRTPETTFLRRSQWRPSPIRFLPPAIPTPTLVLRTFILGTMISASGHCVVLTGSARLCHDLDHESDMLEPIIDVLPGLGAQKKYGAYYICHTLAC